MNSNGKPLAGKSAIVTGAATGIGKAIAARLARDGAAIVVNHLRSQRKKAEAVVAALRNGRGTALAVAADISKREQFAELFDRAEQAFGRVDVHQPQGEDHDRHHRQAPQRRGMGAGV